MMVPMPHNVSMTINRRKKQLDAALLFITTVQEAKRKPDDKRLQAQIDGWSLSSLTRPLDSI
jgi:hypothetical protein